MENEELLPKPLTDLSLPEKEISENANPISQGDALEPQNTENGGSTPNFSSKWIKFGIIVVILLALLGGVYMLGKNSANKQASQAPLGSPKPTAEAATPTPNPTVGWKITDSETNVGWKTYTNIKNGFSIEYPADILIAENDACSSIKNDYLGLFKKRAEEKYSCGSDEPYYFYANVVENKNNINAENPCYTNVKQEIMIDNITAEKYTTTWRKDKKCAEAGIGPISTERISIYVTNNGKLYLITWPVLDINQNVYDQIISTFKFTK